MCYNNNSRDIKAIGGKFKMTLKSLIENKRVKLGLNLQEMSYYLGISRTTLRRIYSEEQVGTNALDKISKVLNVSRKTISKLQGGIK